MTDQVPVRRVLISVSDKTDLIPFAKYLTGIGATLISTGGTARTLSDAGIPVTPVDAVTDFPEMMDGRVKTLHPKIHGGLLALRDNPEHVAAMRDHDIEPIDLVCVNLYPFEKTIARDDVTDAEAIEQIDIGGPSMVRSAAKNIGAVAVVTDPSQYDRVVMDMKKNDGATSQSLRQSLAAAAFARTAAYDTAIAEWMNNRSNDKFPETLLLRYDRRAELRYGENPHQAGAVYVDPHSKIASIAQATQKHGKALSFCNIYDADGALNLVREIPADESAAVAVIKHANPCGFATAATLEQAFEQAYAGDPLAAFGGIVACNQPVDEATAQHMVEGQKFLEVIIAPSFDQPALDLLRERWKNVRLLETGPIGSAQHEADFKRIVGGLLIHERDELPFDTQQWEHVAGPAPEASVLADMRLAMIAVKHLKSNAVCLVNGSALAGAGAGQMDRLASCRIAIEKAGDRAKNAVVGSDAFFPFRDGPDQLIKAGVRGIVQPGGSKRDDDTIAACNDAGVSLMFTGRRHFRH